MPDAVLQECGGRKAGDGSVRFTDKGKAPYYLGTDNEATAIQFARDYGQTYAKYPFMIYQIQNKFREETSLKADLIKLREFIAKEAWSFHASQEDMRQHYDKCYKAYEKIFARAGIPDVIPVVSGYGAYSSHEFVLLNPAGDKPIAVCGVCDYRASAEVAENVVETPRDAVSEEMADVHTPDSKTIDDLCAFMNTTPDKCTKAVVYQRSTDDTFVAVFLRGDLDISETKLKNYLGCEVYPAIITEASGICAGYIGPQNQSAAVTVLFDNSLKDANNLVTGANKEEYHCSGLDMIRDLPNAEYHDLSEILEGGLCPKCRQKAISIQQGIEVGSIAQIGSKYSELMGMKFAAQEGGEASPVMGCYNINISQLAATVCEARHDDYGPVWPTSIAPWQVHICALRSNDEAVAAASAALYNDLLNLGVEVIFDNRLESAGVIFADADLLGVPVRVIASPKTIGRGVLEIKTRDKSVSEDVEISKALEFIQSLIK